MRVSESFKYLINCHFRPYALCRAFQMALICQVMEIQSHFSLKNVAQRVIFHPKIKMLTHDILNQGHSNHYIHFGMRLKQCG